MSAHDLSNARWIKSSRSSQNGQCCECAQVGDVVAVRDSKDPAGPALVFERPEWASFLGAVKAGQFDL